MTFYDYNQNIPFATNNPSDDQPEMLVNTNSIFSIIAKDHHGFEDNLGGYHNIIHQNPQLIDPAAIPSINQIYVKNYTPDTTGGVADTQLFTRTGNGGISQLTGNSSQAEGYQWLGGVLIQWGFKTFSGVGDNAGTITFKNRVAGAIPFPNNLFNVTAQVFYITTPPVATNSANIFIDKDATFTRLQFKWAVNSTSHGNIRGFFWQAIGN